tara:strand:- start:105 stop:497 length:393 start_codon:yes stop_codon:yes gene_type:complete
MPDKVLMLDGLCAIGYTEIMGKGIGYEIDHESSIEAAKGRLAEIPSPYSAVLVEPFLYFAQDATPLLEFMIETKESGLAVVIVSTEEERALNRNVRLVKNTHYDGYVSKLKKEPLPKLKEILDSLVPAEH